MDAVGEHDMRQRDLIKDVTTMKLEWITSQGRHRENISDGFTERHDTMSDLVAQTVVCE